MNDVLQRIELDWDEWWARLEEKNTRYVPDRISVFTECVDSFGNSLPQDHTRPALAHQKSSHTRCSRLRHLSAILGDNVLYKFLRCRCRSGEIDFDELLFCRNQV
jgi:hypothetical protein